MQVIQAQLAAGMEIIRAIADAIRELKSVPSGHLYARLCGNMSLSEYQQIIGILQRSKVIVVEPSHLIRWIAD